MDYKIKLGVTVDTSDLKTELNSITNNTHRIRIDIDNSRLLKQINHAKKELKELKDLSGTSGNASALNINTKSVEGALDRVASAVDEIRLSLNTLDGKSGMQSLVASVNQIATALGKATDESETLVKSLNALSKKDFNVNLGITMGGSNPVGRNAAYGNKVRNDTLPQLKQQMNDLVKFYNTTYKESLNEFEALQKLVSGTKLNNGDFFESFLFGKDSVATRMSGGSLAGQMNAYKQYIDMFIQAANLKGLDISSITSGFSKSADDLIKDAQDVQTGAKEMEDGFEKLKQVFGGGNNFNVEGISAQLDSIVVNLGEIKTAIQGLSSGTSLDGLTQSFDRLSGTLETLLANAKQVQDVLGGSGVSGATSGMSNQAKQAQDTAEAYKEVANEAKKINNISVDISDGNIDSGIKTIDNELKQISVTANNTTDAIQSMKNAMLDMKFNDSSVEAATRSLEDMDITIKEVSAQQKNGVLQITVKGINEAKEAVAVIKQLNTTTNGFDTISTKISKSFDDGTEAAKRFKKEAETVKNIKLNIEVGKFDDDIDRMITNFNKLSLASEDLCRSKEEVENAYRELQLASEADTGDEVVDRQRLIQAEEQYAKALKKTNNLIREETRAQNAKNAAEKLMDDKASLKLDMINWLKKNTKAAKEYGGVINELILSLDKLDDAGQRAARRQFTNYTKQADIRGLTGLTLFDQIKEKFKEYSAYFSVAEVFMYAQQALSSMFEQVKLIDSAMTELKKVTNETDDAYNQFLSNAGSRAKEIGTTIDGLVSSTADFARLGYEFADAQGLAEVANIYAVVGDDIDSVETATQSLISTLTAFKDEAGDLSESDFALSIVDKMNEVKFDAS